MAKVNDRFASAHEMVREYQELEKEMADPSIHDDQGKARKLGRRYAQLGPVVAGFNAWKTAADDLEAAREMAQEDESFASEIPVMETAVEAAAEKLEELLLPRDPNDDRDVIIEVKAGAGGDESALFAGDLVRMYQRYAEKRGWKVEIIDMTESDLGGYKDISMAIKSKGTPEPAPHLMHDLNLKAEYTACSEYPKPRARAVFTHPPLVFLFYQRLKKLMWN